MLKGNEEYEKRFKSSQEIKIDISNLRIITQNLTIRPLINDDVNHIFKHFDKHIARYLYYKGCENLQDAQIIVNRSLQGMENGDRIVFSIIDKLSGEFFGCIGLYRLDSSNPELGFMWVKKESQGTGIFAEASVGVLKWICQNIKFNYLFCFVDDSNQRGKEFIKSWGGIVGDKLPSLETKDPSKILNVVEYRIYKEHLSNILGI